jgi:hypothetical protein
VKIVLIRTGEELTYPLSAVMEEPEVF